MTRRCHTPALLTTGRKTFCQTAVSAFVIGVSLAGCAHAHTSPALAHDDAVAAVRQSEPAAPVQVVELPKAVPLPGQLTRVGRDAGPASEPGDPATRVNLANAAARMQPARGGFINSMQVYPFVDGALYQVYTAPGEITDIALQRGEELAGAGPVAAGDTVRWIIGDTQSGAGPSQQVHILVKPTRAELTTNLVINTALRTYHLELRSTLRTYMASVSWQYPQDQLIAIQHQAADAQSATPIASGIDLAHINFRYEVTGDRADWRPLRAFDDGHQVYIAFPPGIGEGEMPPLFVVGPKGKDSELVNYRVRGDYMIVDRLFAAAELRLGAGKKQTRVRITRSDGRAAS
jgi:P-type conjugative transfer protein TrbG